MNPERTTILLSNIVFDEGLYPRVEGHDPCVVQIEAPRQTVAEWLKSFAELSAADISAFSTDFTPPLYNIWKQQTESGGPR